MDAAGALGKPIRLLAGHHRQRDRRAGVRGRHRRHKRRHRFSGALPGRGGRLAGPREGLDRHDNRAVLLRAVLPAAHKDGNPNAGTTYNIGDSGPSNVDQRRVVDPSFLDLVRLGVLPADDPAVVNTLGVVDAQLGVPTANGFFWHRASFDGYGEELNGDQWDFGFPNDSLITRGRPWPLLNGERG
jgi:hypothetical protein